MFGKKKKNEYEEVVEEGRDELDVDYNDDEDFETDFISQDEDEDERPKERRHWQEGRYHVWCDLSSSGSCLCWHGVLL